MSKTHHEIDIFQFQRAALMVNGDIRSTGFEKPFKISSRLLKMEKCFFIKKWNLYWKNTIKSNFLMET